MKIEICMDRQELRGTQAVSFEVYDSDGGNVGTLIVAKPASGGKNTKRVTLRRSRGVK